MLGEYNWAYPVSVCVCLFGNAKRTAEIYNVRYYRVLFRQTAANECGKVFDYM